MTSVKVVDLNEEAHEEQPAIEPIDEATEEPQQPELLNDTSPEARDARDVVEETNEEPPAEPKEEPVKPKPKAKPKASDIVKCDKCDKSMSYKNFRYSHNCDPKPVKKQANPKPKTKPKAVPKPPPEVYYSSSDDDDAPQQPLIKNKQKQPSNPLLDASPEARVLRDITNSYALLQQQSMQQRQEKYNKVCAGMFGPRMKKRY